SNKVCPSVCPLTLGVPIRVLLYISFPHQSTTLHQVFPSQWHLASGILIRVPSYTQSTPFYLISPSECPFTSHCPSECPFPSRAHQSAPFHSICPFVPP
ncbi:unnamed protein product, partial [Staurois parvus]